MRAILIFLSCAQLAAVRLPSYVTLMSQRKLALRPTAVHSVQMSTQNKKNVNQPGSIDSLSTQQHPSTESSSAQAMNKTVRWKRFLARVQEHYDEHDEADTAPSLQSVTAYVNATIRARRRRLNFRLARALEKFRKDVLEEASLQVWSPAFM